MMDSTALALNSDCYCWNIDRRSIVDRVVAEDSVANMSELLSTRPHYFANTAVFLSETMQSAMTDQISAIETVIKSPGFRDAVQSRMVANVNLWRSPTSKGVFMGYDFHITEDGPRLIEVNSNAGGAFIVNMLEQSSGKSSANFANAVIGMFKAEWELAGHMKPLSSIAIVDKDPEQQFHYPDMCLAKSLLEKQGLHVVITDPNELSLSEGMLFHKGTPIDLVYNRLTDFELTAPENAVIQRAYKDAAAVITPAPHHHTLFADKRNLILLSDQDKLEAFGATTAHRKTLELIPKTKEVTLETADAMWANRKSLFFKPKAGFGSRGAFRGAKLTKKVWSQILEGGYVAQELITPPTRAVTVNTLKTALKFDVRVYTYDGTPLLYAARVYQGQTTNLRTAGGGLAPVIPVGEPGFCG